MRFALGSAKRSLKLPIFSVFDKIKVENQQFRHTPKR